MRYLNYTIKNLNQPVMVRSDFISSITPDVIDFDNNTAEGTRIYILGTHFPYLVTEDYEDVKAEILDKNQ